MLSITGDGRADRLLSEEPLALLVGMLLDQQVPMERAFTAPADLKDRLGGRLDAAAIAAMDPERLAETFKAKPSLHRYPSSMAGRVQELCRIVATDYGNDAASIWSGASGGEELLGALRSLPGFGDQKARIFLALLGKQLGVDPPGWREASAPYGEPRELPFRRRHRFPCLPGEGAGEQEGGKSRDSRQGIGEGVTPGAGPAAPAGPMDPAGPADPAGQPAHEGPGAHVRPAGRHDRWGLGRRRLYLCVPIRADLERFVGACIAGGVDVVQLRDKNLDDAAILAAARTLRKVCADHGVPFVLNDRPDLAAEAGADGVHVGQDDVTPEVARETVGDAALVGLSTHAPDQLEAAVARHAPVDYLSAGPVVPTPTKPGRPGTGTGYLTEAVGRSPWPVWVTGGVEPDTVGALVDAGARHFVAVRWLTEADDPRSHARRLRQVIDAELARLSER